MDREAGESISGVEEEVYRRTSVSSTGFRQKMRIEVYALNYTTSGVLSIKYKDRRWRLVTFLSKFLNKSKRNYKIHNKEILVVIRELENWRYLLEGAKFKFEVWIDHKNLEYFIKIQKLNRRQSYHIIICY